MTGEKSELVYQYAGNNPIKFIDPDGKEVAALYIKNSNEGTLIVMDNDTGITTVIKAESGGKPYGDPIPDGNYDILYHPKSGFFRLESKDNNYGDDVDSKTKRFEFRLHRPGRTYGCIAAKDAENWTKVVNGKKINEKMFLSNVNDNGFRYINSWMFTHKKRFSPF